ncbi:MauE/DoxX family redox-associated membrane protein [Streptomyces sp. 7N604]|uniref:MauE/DoxX family redox-associated membrane protein n=1 Tax=Streptomyces sp. 7N604 TaxID=3457415 RepID=UPI003FD516CA
MVLRTALGAVFTAMAVGQLASFEEMPSILAAYGLVAGGAATALAVVLIIGELICGTWFLTRPRSGAIAPVWVYTAVSLIWSTLAVQAYARGLAVENCGCFGVYLPQSLSWIVLAQDALVLLYAAVLLHGARRGPVPAAPRDGSGSGSGDGKGHGNGNGDPHDVAETEKQ